MPGTTLETRVPAAGSTETVRRRAKTEDFAFLARLPARKPETFDRDAITRAVWLVGGLALGLWLIMIIARPSSPPNPEPEQSGESFFQEAPPIHSTGNGLAPAPQDLKPTPEIISLTPAPVWTPPPPAAAQPPARRAPVGQAPYGQQAPAGQAPAMAPGVGAGESEAGMHEGLPTVADTPDPSNLFTSP
jgi:hypothetical protein